MLLSMLSYARFFKHTKRATSVPMKAFLAFDASSIISHEITLKYKDPSRPTILIVIRDHLIHKVLLGLGVNFDLKPFTEYERLRLGELKYTKTVI